MDLNKIKIIIINLAMRARLKQLIGVECVSVFIDTDEEYNCFPDVIITNVGWFHVDFQFKYYYAEEEFQQHSRTFRIADILSIDVNISELQRRQNSYKLNRSYNKSNNTQSIIDAV